MADEIDETQAAMQYRIDVQITNIRNAIRVAVPSLSVCEECGNDIPPQRRQALPGVCLCVECQRAIEIYARHHHRS